MTLNKNNWFAIYYNWIYGNYPKDICSFFWGTLFAIGVFFLLIPGKLLAPNGDKNNVVAQFFLGIVAWLCYALTVVIGTLVIDAFGYEFINLWGFLLLGALIGALVIAVLLALFIGTIYFTVEKLPETSAVQNTQDFVGAIRQKHCTKITWK